MDLRDASASKNVKQSQSSFRYVDTSEKMNKIFAGVEAALA